MLLLNRQWVLFLGHRSFQLTEYWSVRKSLHWSSALAQRVLRVLILYHDFRLSATQIELLYISLLIDSTRLVHAFIRWKVQSPCRIIVIVVDHGSQSSIMCRILQSNIKDLTGFLDDQTPLVRFIFSMHWGHRGLLFIAQVLFRPDIVHVTFWARCLDALVRACATEGRPMIDRHRLFVVPVDRFGILGQVSNEGDCRWKIGGSSG